ncbi:hypothetical protein SARC_13620 [Sphaeroforma arctica JP610]|uniref:Amino acid permease/ SLC12A domain-containing protein n=1 Tax=Sphaeroforma arctica JP610 TaxID=667725 RepID=A0A0L0FAP9_9EUKA|nr:hypothetical protein SARC_13620 [Sphaeroforma arctica JP610]KNC73824.1 hypothetical protein SARC_13620 [Sphaeroforma arctica JP610]|eukprot:XP_014147726.1 hypothetical protein SARC_13620 [Sphaeroforma arctica JP610]
MYDADADYEEENLVGTFVGTYMPTCSAMWGALIFIRFGIITGQAGLVLALGMTLGSALIVSLTAASVSALSTNGAMAPDGPNGVYFLVTRNLGTLVSVQDGESIYCICKMDIATYF